MPKHIVLRTGNQSIPALLNDTVAAKDFEKRIPFKVTMRRCAADYCTTVASGIFDPLEVTSGWKNGDISLANGWFSILFDGEEDSGKYHGIMPIAHIDLANIPCIKGLSETVTIIVEYAQENKQGKQT